ncbi:hypothetical protein COU76_05375 [Candidatus Peregrinibacteria bacterium CG10_big_fil_rev_8_21_14_0_10_49_10]|nr:MAG: hypothetical protein COU76_05375 [Candidatus Peregrinibacteria bacterium CG10_big_fil_rev_8_21_14_0_10_49_10]
MGSSQIIETVCFRLTPVTVFLVFPVTHIIALAGIRTVFVPLVPVGTSTGTAHFGTRLLVGPGRTCTATIIFFYIVTATTLTATCSGWRWLVASTIRFFKADRIVYVIAFTCSAFICAPPAAVTFFITFVPTTYGAHIATNIRCASIGIWWRRRALCLATTFFAGISGTVTACP